MRPLYHGDLRTAALQKRRMSPEVSRDALQHRQNFVLRHIHTDHRYTIPSLTSPETKLIYETLGLT